MAAPLQFKQRVRLPDEPWLPATGRRRRGRLALLGAALWLGLALLCYAVGTGAVPVARWLGAARAPLAQRAAESRTGPLRGRAVQPAGVERSGVRAAGAKSAPGASAIEPAPAGSATPTAATIVKPPASRTPFAHVASQGIDPFAAVDGIGERARDNGEATVDDAPSMATSSGIKRISCEDAIEADRDRNVAPSAASPGVAKVVESGHWFGDCGSVKLFEVHVCVAVRNGRTVGVTARTLPAHHAIASCIANQAWGLGFPKSPHLEIARASFAPE